jgi:hypothetical protein
VTHYLLLPRLAVPNKANACPALFVFPLLPRKRHNIAGIGVIGTAPEAFALVGSGFGGALDHEVPEAERMVYPSRIWHILG